MLVHETDESKGGASMDDLEEECKAHTTGLSDETRFPLPPGALERVFGEDAAARLITWVRVSTFQVSAHLRPAACRLIEGPAFDSRSPQIVSLRMIAEQLLAHAPHCERQKHLLERGLFVPGELQQARFQEGACLLYSDANRGAKEVARELQTAHS